MRCRKKFRWKLPSALARPVRRGMPKCSTLAYLEQSVNCPGLGAMAFVDLQVSSKGNHRTCLFQELSPASLVWPLIAFWWWLGWLQRAMPGLDCRST